MINSLWLIEGAPWPARKKYLAHNEAVRAFEAELGIVKALPPGPERTKRAEALVLYSCTPITWAEVTADGTVRRRSSDVRPASQDCDEGGAEDQRCTDGEQADEQGRLGPARLREIE